MTMFRVCSWRRILFLTAALGLLFVAPVIPQQEIRTVPPPDKKTEPRLEPYAETALLMQAINLPNFRGLEQILGRKPTGDDAWIYARGQALLIAENGNLLMLRPPKKQG